MTGWRAGVLAVVVGWAVSGCTDREKLAREHLAGAGYTDVVLTAAGGEGSFAFTARRGGEACKGSIGVHAGGATTTFMLASDCEP